MTAAVSSLRPWVLGSVFFLFSLGCAWAVVGGRIHGTVKDPSGAFVAKAAVTAINTGTGVKVSTATDEKGIYAFPLLPAGRYDIAIDVPGFRPYRCTGVIVDSDSASIIDATLTVGTRADWVIVEDSGVRAETSDTQMGEVISGTQMAAVPLNGRSYTDLLALQPGVAPATSLTSGTQQDVGVSALSPSGDLNPGTISINGQREFSNAFTINGSDAEEDVNAGTAIIPNLDSIAEFRILTNNFDAETGGHSGGQISVVTKSGTNQFHGDVFEFLRNTSLDARNYFSPARGLYDQNQFGATFGGPLRKNKVFFFADYQGTRLTQGIDTGTISVPSLQDRSGNLADLTGYFVTTDQNGNTVPTTVNGASWAALLSRKLTPYSVSPGEPYYYAPATMNPATKQPYGAYCTSHDPTTGCVFPGGIIPLSAWSAPANNLLQYIPAPNAGADSFATSAYNEALRDDKGAYRLDANSRWGLFSAYYFLDDYTLNNPYPVAQSGASVPGFNDLNLGRAQLVSLGYTKTLSTTAVNDFHFSYLRDDNNLGKPVGGLGVSLASQGFQTGVGTQGIVPLNPQGEGVENIIFNEYSIGTTANELKQANNTFQWNIR